MYGLALISGAIYLASGIVSVQVHTLILTARRACALGTSLGHRSNDTDLRL